LRVPKVARRALALPIVKFWSTKGILATLNKATCKNTSPMKTFLVNVAISVRRAFWLGRHRFTSATISCKSALRANACNTPDGGRCVSDHTLLRSYAWIGSQTRISTGFIHASQFGWAIFVNSTFWLLRHHRLYTRDIAITNQWVSTSAGFSVIPGTTVCSSGTIAWSTKRLAFLLCESTSWYKVTFLICGTVIVTGATCLNASN